MTMVPTVRCADCARLPWVAGADFSALPPARCHPELPAYRWRPEMVEMDRECPFFSPKEGVAEAVNGPAKTRAIGGDGAQTTTGGEGTQTGSGTQERPSVAELVERLKDMTDADEVMALLDAEQASETPRKTALKALEEKLAELTQPTSTDPVA